MALDIYIEDKKVLLAYYPEQIGPDNYLKLLKEKGSRRLYNTFSVSETNFYKIEIDEIIFVIGEEDEGYRKIYANVLGTERDYCFDQKIKLSKKDFIAARKTSILKMMDKIITTNKDEVYIDLNCDYEADNQVCYADFRKFQKAIPHNAELIKYIWMRAATVFGGVFHEADKAVKKHEEWLDRVDNNLTKSSLDNVTDDFDYYHAIDYEKLIRIREKLNQLVNNCDAYQENVFQQAVSEIIRFVFPKYLYAVREVRFKGIDSHDKQPDFVLVDYNGMIDFMEIKKPSVKLINSTTYRNNYSPSRELSGAAQQVEKYIACIHRSADEWEKNPPKKIREIILDEIEIKIINPQGLIVLGDARDFNTDQKRDFELIKRQYKNVAEIITYDDMLNRIDNMIKALKPYVKSIEGE